MDEPPPLKSPASEARLERAIKLYKMAKNQKSAKNAYEVCRKIADTLTLIVASIDERQLQEKRHLESWFYDPRDRIRQQLLETARLVKQLSPLMTKGRSSDGSANLLSALLRSRVVTPWKALSQNFKDRRIGEKDPQHGLVPWPTASELYAFRQSVWLALADLGQMNFVSLDARRYRASSPLDGGKLPDVRIWPVLSIAATHGYSPEELAAKLVEQDADHNRAQRSGGSRARRLRNEKDRLRDAWPRWIARFYRVAVGE